MEQPIVAEVSWASAGMATVYSYTAMTVLMTVIIIVSTFAACAKTHIGASVLLGLSISVVPAVLYGLSSKITSIRKPFAEVFTMMGITPERSMLFAGMYILLLCLLPLVVYAVHSAEESACVASPDEMTAFKTKMLKELQEKQEVEEKNAKKK